MKYFAFYKANNSTYNQNGYEYTNLKVAEKEIKDIAVGETYAGNQFTWEIRDVDGNIVSSGLGIKSNNGKISYRRL